MLSSLTIAEAHRRLAKKEVSATELMQACLDRIATVDKTLNAVVYLNADKAIAQAKEIDKKGDFSNPLSGIPYLAKDVYCEAGVPTTACSNMLREKTYTPPFDSTTTKRLKAAGAISIGKSNTDEFTMGASTETSCYGVTRCPWDTTRVAGGSSGGSAAGVSADECLFALGTDTGGSIRQPAGFCNCTGLRTTYGRTSRYGVMSMASSLDTIGPICKTVEDTAHVLKAIAGKDSMDATTSDMPVPDYPALLKKDMKGLRVGVPKEYFIDGLNGEVEGAVREAAKVLQSLGATLVDISLPHTKYALATYYVLCPCEVSSNMARYDGIRYGHTTKNASDLADYYKGARSSGFGVEVQRRIMIGTYALSSGYYDAYYLKAQKVRTLICQDFKEAFAKVDVVISPVSPTPAFRVGAHANDPVAMYLEDAFMDGAVMAGIPALSVQCGFSKPQEGIPALPIGLQMMGPQWGEATLLSAAHAYQCATDWHTRKPAL
jgi:aspartyl-tRNA(Asn)/glutamyl-tRNA(Gln) amidotransferase subunit A